MDPFLGEIRIFAGTFAPNGWFFCQGQLLAIRQYTALYALLGVQYGGDGRTTFALPNLQGSMALGMGMGPGLSSRPIGQTGGTPTVTLDLSQIPPHTHNFPLPADSRPGNTRTAAGNVPALEGTGQNAFYSAPGTPTGQSMAAVLTPFSGGGQAHDNMPPYLALNYIIAALGVFPQRQ
jgi:microcystin-dependent protein